MARAEGVPQITSGQPEVRGPSTTREVIALPPVKYGHRTIRYIAKDNARLRAQRASVYGPQILESTYEDVGAS